MQAQSLARAFAEVDEYWSPRAIGRINDYEIRVAKIQGEFTWHQHSHTDEFFLVHSGKITIQFKDRPDVTLSPGDCFVVPKGVEHCPKSEGVSEILLFEPAVTVNTGD